MGRRAAGCGDRFGGRAGGTEAREGGGGARGGEVGGEGEGSPDGEEAAGRGKGPLGPRGVRGVEGAREGGEGCALGVDGVSGEVCACVWGGGGHFVVLVRACMC